MSSETESRIPSTAAQGNLLEAINVTLNVLSLHYIDRDLHRTGNSIVVISAGNGVFEVGKKMAGITKQRMMDNGIGSDMLVRYQHIAPRILRCTQCSFTFVFFLAHSALDYHHSTSLHSFYIRNLPQ